jgi:hypothetical protein
MRLNILFASTAGSVQGEKGPAKGRIASRLTMPFERLPFFNTRVVREDETLELGAIRILEMNRLHILGWAGQVVRQFKDQITM